MKILSYGNKETELFDLEGKIGKKCKWAKLENVVRRKLDILLAGQRIEDFKIPPNNRFEWLKGNLLGFASIRINKQWRIIFRVSENNELLEVEVVNYHRG